jgi:2-polyprenyl-6-methoxyphenol hydroxylase-like FAD-dependent oxidoreductase
MDRRPVLVAGGGIGGLSVALTLHQIGVPCVVLESVRHLQPLGVGINLQPNAVRELYELGIGPEQLDAIGLQTREFVLVGLNGKEVYSEPRGVRAGYKWPQYSVHRGGLQMLLYQAVVDRLGTGAVREGMAVIGYRHDAEGTGVRALVETRDGERHEIEGSLLIGADGLHSAVRAQMYPAQPPIQWGGAIHVARHHTRRADPDRRLVRRPGHPSPSRRLLPDLESRHGHRTRADQLDCRDHRRQLGGWTTGDWNRRVDVESFIHHFEDWNYDWLDVPAMLRGADAIFEYPMIDRDPCPRGGRPGRAAGRCGARDVPNRFERGESGGDRRARAGRRHPRARR